MVLAMCRWSSLPGSMRPVLRRRRWVGCVLCLSSEASILLCCALWYMLILMCAGGCVSLQELSASHNQIRFIPEELASCKALQALKLNKNM